MRFLTTLMAAVTLLAGLLGAGPLAAADAPFAPKPGQGTFLILSDIHFDPFVSKEVVAALAKAPIEDWDAILKKGAFPPYGEDSNYSLFASSLAASSALQPAYDYVLVLGDLLAHDFNARAAAILGGDDAATRFSLKTSRFIAREIQAKFGATPVIPAIGNNDDSCGNYHSEPQGAYLETLAKSWDLLKGNRAAQRDFIRLGSFSIRNPKVANHRIVSLNTVLFARKYVDTCRPQDPDPGTALLDWLENELKDAQKAGDVVTLVMHIPPGFDNVSSGLSTACAAVLEWQPQYEQRYRELARKYRGVLSLAFAGHLHEDTFRVFNVDRKPYSGVYIAPSVSPVYDNNPSFVVVLYTRGKGEFIDYSVQYTQLNTASPSRKWQQEYKWSAAYGLNRIDAPRLAWLSRQVVSAPPPGTPAKGAAGMFSRNYFVRSGYTLEPSVWSAYTCAVNADTIADYSACRCPAD